MENALRQINKNQKSIESNVPGHNQGAALYSPLVVNGIECGSNNDNAHIMGSERTGVTPNQPAIVRQTSIGPAVISEFNPIDELGAKVNEAKASTALH